MLNPSQSRKPIVRSFWRRGNSLAMIGSAKQRLHEISRNDLADKLEQETQGLKDYNAVIKVISKYCEIY